MNFLGRTNRPTYTPAGARGSLRLPTRFPHRVPPFRIGLQRRLRAGKSDSSCSLCGESGGIGLLLWWGPGRPPKTGPRRAHRFGQSNGLRLTRTREARGGAPATHLACALTRNALMGGRISTWTQVFATSDAWLTSGPQEAFEAVRCLGCFLHRAPRRPVPLLPPTPRLCLLPRTLLSRFCGLVGQ